MSNFIEKVHIENFKSIESIDLNCKRINIFIGPPGSGKSNILEAIGLLSKYTLDKFPESIRIYDYTKLNEIFHYNNIYKSLIIEINGEKLEVNYIGNETIEDLKSKIENNIKNNKLLSELYKKIKFYRFRANKVVLGLSSQELFLLPPYGENLIDILKKRKDITQELGLILFKKYGLVLADIVGYNDMYLVPEDNFNNKNLEMIVTSIKLLSDGLLRYIFDLLITKTNKDSIILLEDPVGEIQPFYIKDIALRILESNNQFFISTHSDLLVQTILEKIDHSDISIFWVDYDKNTIIKEISEEKLKEFYEESIFSNIVDAAQKVVNK